MNPFQVENYRQQDESVMVGAHVPRPISEFISLHALYKGATKSSIIRRLMEEWYDKETRGDMEKAYIHNLAERAANEWKARKSGNLGQEGWQTKEDIAIRRNEYLDELNTILNTRSIANGHRRLLLQTIRRMTHDDATDITI